MIFENSQADFYYPNLWLFMPGAGGSRRGKNMNE
jgi:hypothetical protein